MPVRGMRSYDTDGDGIRDSADADDSQFGETGDTPSKDTDGDGVPDARDLDSDNDIQALTASDIADRAMRYGAVLTHILLHEKLALPPGALTGDDYRNSSFAWERCF